MKNSTKPLRIWLVGASEGIGFALLAHWLQAGHCVVASSRSAQTSPNLKRLQQAYPTQLRCMNLDVTESDESVDCVQQAWSAFGGLDMWFYNVGLYQPMRMDEWVLADFERMMRANYWGAVRLMLSLKPYFITQGHGHWVWNISLAAYFGLPYGGGYSAPKAALLNLAESLQPELAQAGIRLQVINHGFVQTRLTAKNNFTMPGLMTAEQAAQRIQQALAGTSGFEIRFPFALRAMLSLLKLLPYRWSLALSRRLL